MPALALLALLAGAEPAAAVARGTTVRAEVGDGLVAALTEDHQLFLEATPEPGEGLLGFARRLAGSVESAAAISRANGGTSRLLAGVRYRVPFTLLEPHGQMLVVRALFTDDRGRATGWEHRVGTPPRAGRESLWHIAEWFTGNGENYPALRRANGLVDDDLAPGQRVLVPAHLLRPVFRSTLPAGSPYHLAYGGDGEGEFAIYRLRPGEALYSSVVVRFTGRIFADDVNALAAEVAERSGIADVTDIPIGYEVKVPFDLLLPEFLPEGHPRRREYEAGLLASAQFSNRVTARRLQGVTLVLDAGHGGNDVGASTGGVWESLYVYDIMLRTKRLLEETTAARVIATTQDGETFAVPDRDRLSFSKTHRVLTTPNYHIEDSTVGVHLRWYLANSVLRQAIDRGEEPDKVVFISIHADSLHPSLRGAMAYIPGAQYRGGGSYGKSGAAYASRREVRERPRVSFSHREMVRSEGLSRDLARHVIEAFARGGLAVHADKPIREKVIRHRRAWVPAVLRYNAVPAQMLLEVCNLANAEDRRLIQTRRFRQQVAEAVVAGILGYYADGETGDDLQVASAGRTGR